MRLFLFVLILVVGCQQSSEQKKDQPISTVVEKQPSELTDSLFKTEIGWGYDILLNGKPFIHQPHIPGISGNKGFDSEGKAQKAADFIKFKIKNKIMPPSVTEIELDSIGAL